MKFEGLRLYQIRPKENLHALQIHYSDIGLQQHLFVVRIATAETCLFPGSPPPVGPAQPIDLAIEDCINSAV
jgi:hypothetical protein